MATWEDGPEYAPLERPAEFSVPPVPPLEVIEPAHQPAANAPPDRPRFDQPEAAVAPLASLIPPVDERRDPAKPFEVVASTVTSSAWGAAHWSASSGPPEQPVPSTVAPAPWGPPTGSTWPSPAQPITPAPGPVSVPGGFPAPGTPAWFSSPPPAQPSYPAPVTARRVLQAATPGLLICLGVGGLIPPAAPLALALAAALSSRVQVARDKVRRIFVAAVTALVAIAGFTALAVEDGFGEWWAGLGLLALVLCWGSAIAVSVVIYRDLTQSSTAPPNPPPWR